MNASGGGGFSYRPDVQMDDVMKALAEWKRKPNDTIEKIFAEAGWEYEDGYSGEIALFFEYDKFTDHAQELLEAIAPFVEYGHVEMTTEYQEYFQLAFVDGELEEYEGHIIFPGSPYADPDI